MKVKEVIEILKKLPQDRQELPFVTYDEVRGKINEVEKVMLFRGDDWLEFEGKAILVK